MSVIAFAAVPKFAWGTILSLVFAWYAYKSLSHPMSRKIFVADGLCNALAGAILFTLALLDVLTVRGRIITVSIFLCATAVACFYIYQFESRGQAASK
jgi:hypothetical protein